MPVFCAALAAPNHGWKADTDMRVDRILIHYAEIALKGRNRRDFERALRGNIRHRLRAEGIAWPVRLGHDRITVEPPEQPGESVETVLALLMEIPGIASFAPSAFVGGTPSGDEAEQAAVTETVLAQANATGSEAGSFAVRVNRADKRYPIKSDELARRLGAAIQGRTPWSEVNLNRPHRRFHVDLYPEGIYVYTDKYRGAGGLPVGSGGHLIGLLSGGIDSPVAAYRMAKRGCRVDFLHMTASQAVQANAPENLVARIAARLSRYTLRSRLVMVPYTYFDMGLIGHAQTGYEMILFRRFVARVGERVAALLGAEAMVAGDSLGQVASQTLENMVTSSMAARMPVLRPLVGDDKQEIIDLARRIGTYELSIQPYKDCCALISHNPRTRSTPEVLETMEAELFPDYGKLIDTTLEDGVMVHFDSGRVVSEAPLTEVIRRRTAPTDA